MAETIFQNWREANPFIEDYLLYPEGEDYRWGRIRANWNEKGENEKDLSHICAFAFDFQTGDIYFDCQKPKIWAKCVFSSVGRPIFGLIKTAYHLCLPISIPLEIFKAIFQGILQNQSCDEIAGRAWRNIKRNFADIIRTPVYTVAMLIVTLAAVIIGPFAPSKLYDLRALIGRLERALNWGEESLWTLAPCFQPINNVMEIHRQNYQKADTEYEDEETLKGLNNLARNYVKFKREHRVFFNNCFRLHSEEEPYISAAYSN